EFEPATGTIWGYFNPRGTACFSLGLLKDIRAHDNALAVNHGHVELEGVMTRANYYVAASRTPKIFNPGGDLALFVLLIKARDRDGLAQCPRVSHDDRYPRPQHDSSATRPTLSP